MNTLKYSLRALTHKPVRTALTVLGIAVSIAAFISITGLTRGVQDSIEKGLAEGGADLIITQKGSFTLVGGTLPASLPPRLESVEGVAWVSGVLFNVTTADEKANVVVAGREHSDPAWNKLEVSAGRLPHQNEHGVAVLGNQIALALAKSIGDEIDLHYEKFRVVGIADFKSVLNQNIVLVHLSDLQTLLSRPGLVTFFEMRLRRPVGVESIGVVRTNIAEGFPGVAIQQADRLSQDLRLVGIIRAIASTISVVILVLALIAVSNTMLMAVSEQAYDMAILSAIGWPAWRIRSMIVFEGVAMAVGGAAVGSGLGLLVMHAAARSSLAAGFLQPYLSTRMIVEAILATLAIGTFGALYPAWRATRVHPAEGLRRS